jgi:HSP20 family protein
MTLFFMALFTRIVKNNENNKDNYNLLERPPEEEPIINEPLVSAEPLAEATRARLRDSEWLDKNEADGQLAVDVFQTEENVIIKSTIAGVKPEDIDVAIDNDMVTIRGSRHKEEEIKEEDFFYQECYWGDFSRSIVLPVEVKAEETEAILKNGVLTLILPKAQKTKSIAVKVKGE